MYSTLDRRPDYFRNQKKLVFIRSTAWRIAVILLAVAFCGQLATAEKTTQLFPPPALAPLVMSASQGKHVFKSSHHGVFNGQKVSYAAAVEEAVIRLQDRKSLPAAHLYTISYLAQNVEDLSDRPVMFIFNGGPGASSVFLHLCGLGPVKLDRKSTRLNSSHV